MSTNSTVRDYLVSVLEGVTDVPTVVVEGTKYKPAVNTPYVRFKLLPAEPGTASIGTNQVQELRGLAQMDVFYPGLVGTTTAEAMANAIVEAFFPAQHLDGSNQVVIDNTWMEAVREDAAWLQVPVLVRWRAYRT